MKSYDFVWIGTGQATGTVVPALRAQGKTIAVIEEDRFGGTCVNWGCTPTKTLVASAKVAHVARTGGSFGVDADVRVDFARVMARMDALRLEETRGFESWLASLADLYRGHAELVGPHEVRIGNEHIRGDNIVIHTGTRAALPDVPGVDTLAVLDNKGLLALTERPEHLVILGGSYIALEFAQIFRRLGSRVTVIQRSPRLMVREDSDVAEGVLAMLGGEGIEFHVDVELRWVRPDGGVTVGFRQNGRDREVVGSHLFAALGRVPNTDRLGLAAAGVSVDAKGYIVTDDRLRTTVPHIYALGDVNGRGAFTHTSVHDGLVLLSQFSGGPPWSAATRIPIHAMFVDPPVARVGLTENELRAAGKPFLMAIRSMDRIGRAREKGETTGFIKVLADPVTRSLVGVTIFGVGGDEVVNLAAAWMASGQILDDLKRTVLVHPTVAELLPWIADDVQEVVP
jgi:pyruvate/2-oxoglutarate dehydrogenase complex dihydrolipoamide dehydrogenase (E3) component